MRDVDPSIVTELKRKIPQIRRCRLNAKEKERRIVKKCAISIDTILKKNRRKIGEIMLFFLEVFIIFSHIISFYIIYHYITNIESEVLYNG